MVKNGYDHSDHRIVKLPVSQEGINRINYFLYADTKSGKREGNSIILGWVWSEMGMAF